MSTAPYSLSDKRVFVAGERGMVGSAIVRRLAGESCEIVSAPRSALDLTDQAAVRAFFAQEKPQAVFAAAAKVGGILANATSPADFLYDNLAIESNVIEAAFREGVEKLIFLGSSCAYPKFADQPIREDTLLTGALEPTNQWYAVAKIAGVLLCDAYRRQHGADFISVMPTNLYGPGDNYDLRTSHVIPALIRKAHDAKVAGSNSVEIWGSGSPRREFLHVDDAADAIVHLMENYSDFGPVNVGVGDDVTILEVAQMVCDVVGFEGRIVTDPTKPDGTPRKLLDVAVLFDSGWRPRYALREGLQDAYSAFLKQPV